MHGGEDAPLGMITLGDPLVPSLGWTLVDLGFGVLTFETLADAASAIEEGLLALIVLNAADEAADPAFVARVRALDADIPVVQAVAEAGTPLPGLDAVLLPPFEADRLAPLLEDLVERHHAGA